MHGLPGRRKSQPTMSGASHRYVISDRHFKEAERRALRHMDSWGLLRKKAFSFLDSDSFDYAMNFLIFVNVAFLIPDIDDSARRTVIPAWRKLASNCFVTIFCVEILTRIYVFRRHFWRSEMNVLDFCVVFLDLASILLEFVVKIPSTSAIRILRLGKLLRAPRLFMQCHEIEVMFGGIAGAFKAIAVGVVLMSVLLLIWSMIAVELVQPMVDVLVLEGAYNCDRCPRAFATVGDSFNTFVQLVLAGDGWGTVCVPLIDRNSWYLVFFVLVIVSVDMGILNLMLSSIVDSAHERRLQNEQLRIQEKNDEYDEARIRLCGLCKAMDVDESGQLTFEELKTGYDTNCDFFDMLHILDVEEEDLRLIFNALDEDHSGSVTHEEFVDQLHKMKTQEAHSMLVFIKCHLAELKYENKAVFSNLNEMRAQQLEELQLIKTALLNQGQMLCDKSPDKSEGVQAFLSDFSANTLLDSCRTVLDGKPVKPAKLRQVNGDRVNGDSIKSEIQLPSSQELLMEMKPGVLSHGLGLSLGSNGQTPLTTALAIPLSRDGSQASATTRGSSHRNVREL